MIQLRYQQQRKGQGNGYQQQQQQRRRLLPHLETGGWRRRYVPISQMLSFPGDGEFHRSELADAGSRPRRPASRQHLDPRPRPVSGAGLPSILPLPLPERSRLETRRGGVELESPIPNRLVWVGPARSNAPGKRQGHCFAIQTGNSASDAPGAATQAPVVNLGIATAVT